MDVDAIAKSVDDSFFAFYQNDKVVSSLLKRIRDGTATYENANRYAVRVGNNLAKAYKATLPTQMYVYDESIVLLQPLVKGYKEINQYARNTQLILNKKYGLNVNPIVPDFNEEKFEGLARTIASAEDVETTLSLFDEPIINFSQNIVDRYISANAEFDSELGFRPVIIREYEGEHEERGKMVDCRWCQGLAGVYDYDDVKSQGSDVYKRHDGCRCVITYAPSSNKSVKMKAKGHAFIG